jgi:excisionase family DNA binding protein
MTVAEAARALNVRTLDHVYRLVRAGVLASTRDERNRIVIDARSVAEYKERVSAKRTSNSFAPRERGPAPDWLETAP